MDDDNLPPELAAHPSFIRQAVEWGDQDAFGHVNNVRYFRWFESARIEYFRRAGLGDSPTNQGIGPILASIKCDFKRQLRFPDALLISSSITHIGRTSLKMAHFIYSTTHQAIAAQGEDIIVMFDYTNQRSILIAEEIRAKIAALEGKPLPPPALSVQK
jgi:acyl-CoA thioester hydrolase